VVVKPTKATQAKHRIMSFPSIRGSISDDAADYIGDPHDTVLHAPALHFIHNLLSHAGIPKTGSGNLHGAGAGEHELDYVGSSTDSAHADHRNPHGLGGFVNHAHGDRLNGGP